MKNVLVVFLIFCSLSVLAQEEDDKTIEVQEEENEGGQSAASKAMDATATQWSFQLAYQAMPDYYDDLVNGSPRRPGLDNYLQLRVVAPVPLKGLTILPRVTIRHYEDLSNGKTGFGNTEIFALLIPKATDWGSGRAGIGPLMTTPGSKDVSKDEWAQLDIVSRWLISTRAAVLIMTFISAALAGLFALRDGAFQFLPWLALTLGLILAHAANNIFNDYTDFVRGVDKDNYFRTIYGAQPIASGLMTKRQHLTYFAVTGILALVISLSR